MRILLGTLVVLLCAAGGSAVFVVEQVHSLSDALKINGHLKIAKGVLSNVGWGQPETLLLVGDDTRKGFKYYHGYVPHLANEMLLVRLDPSKPYISMMSIPRELQAQIYSAQGRPLFVNRLNSAYTRGIGSLVTTITRNYGLTINHVIVATFASFKRAVDDMGCVYSTVDQRYYHVNVPGGEQYQEINLQPGYQRLCGEQALEFVSYRHTDTSLVRDARDQSFLLDVKKQYGPTLIDNVGKFEHIFGQAVVTDRALQSPTELLNLLGTLIKMSKRTVRQVHFQVNIQPTGSNFCSCDTATPQQISASVHAFLYGGLSIPKRSVAAQANAVHKKRVAARLPLVATPASAVAQARAAAVKLPFPLEYPQVEDRGGSVQLPALRIYKISGPGGMRYPAYVAVFKDNGLGNYYDVQGMSWTTAPQFDSPQQKVQVGNRTYYLYYESSNVKMIAWYEHDAVYWVRNSLTDSVPSGEMLAIAEETRPFTVAGSGPNRTPLILQAAHVPFPTTAKHRLPLKEKLGAAAALVTLIGSLLLLFLAIRRFLDLRQARMLLVTSQGIGDRLPVGEPLVAGSGRSPVPLLAGPQDGGTLALPRSGPSGQWLGGPQVYRRFQFRHPAVVLWIVLLVLAGAGGAAYVLTRPHAARRPVHHVKHARPAIPTVPVAVLNATSIPDAAHRLAVTLRAERVKVTVVGNFSGPLPTGNEILYTPGEYAQAERLVRLLGKHATAIPIDPATEGAVGSDSKLVVVIASAQVSP